MILDNLMESYYQLSAHVDGYERESLIEKIGAFPSVATIEAVLNHFKEKLASLVEQEIPFALRGAGMDSCVLTDGTKITIEQVYTTKQGDKKELSAWLEAHGAASLITKDYSFQKGGSDGVDRLLALHGYAFEVDESVHPMTLKKFLKEEYEATGELPPSTAVEVRIFERAKIVESR